MRTILIVFLFSFLAPARLAAQSAAGFDALFVDKTMRVDYHHGGDAKTEFITLDRVFEQGIWAGSRRNLIDPFNLGRYLVKVYDAKTGRLIFSKGFDAYFGDYKTSDDALKGIQKTYHESALIPFPRNKIKLTFEARKRDYSWEPLFSQEIEPAAVTVSREPSARGVKVIDVLMSGDPHAKVDIAVIAEGYAACEEEKLRGDLKRFADAFFKQEPYQTLKSSFNVRGVFKPSEESGCDEPSYGIWKNTAVGASFDSLGSERYMLTEDNKSLRDIAAHVPYDALMIMVNHKRYGGGGIYNLYCTFTSDNQWFEYLFLHEFGHSFAGLGDEYYTSAVAYNEFYPPGLEPPDPNITSLLDPKNLKWKRLATPGIGIPTPWEKNAFESMDNAYQKVRNEINQKIAKMKREAAPAAEVAKAEAESERLSAENARQTDEFLRQSQLAGKVGAFEGAGYAAKGLYRPALDCLMFTRGTKPLCKVCEAAVARVIKQYSLL